jgi:branched-chain amino acid transport system substrate-binding protein
MTDLPEASLSKPNRRSVLKTSLALTAGTLFSPSVLRATTPTIKIGHVSPRTGPMAGFAEADTYMLDQIRSLLSKGLSIGGTQYSVEIITKDSQTDESRTAEVAAELILKDKVDIITASSGSVDTNPVANQAELNEIPCITTDNPWESYYYGRNPPKEGFDWTYHFFWGLDEVLQAFTGLWKTTETNKNVGFLFNTAQDDTSWRDAFTKSIAAAGFNIVDPGQFPPFGNDFTPQINAFKKGGVEIVTGNLFTPDFGTFWTQCAQQGFHPKVVTLGKAFLFPSAIESLGDRASGMGCEVWWTPAHPFKSSLTGVSSQELASAYENATNRPWTQPLAFKHALFEVVIDVLKRSANPKDRDAIIKSINATNLQTIVGPVKWPGPVKNVAVTPIVVGQWQKKNGKFNLEIVGNAGQPGIATTAPLAPLG